MKNVMKKVFVLLIAVLVLVPLFAFYASAEAVAPGNPGTCLLVDDRADMLSAESEAAVGAKFKLISEQYDCDLILLTVNGRDGKEAKAFVSEYIKFDGFRYEELVLFYDISDQTFKIYLVGDAYDWFEADDTDEMEKIFLDEFVPGTDAQRVAALNKIADKFASVLGGLTDRDGADTGLNPGVSEFHLLDDGAGLLSDSEARQLSAKLDSISQKYDFDIVIVTRNGRGGMTVEQYADEYFDQTDANGNRKYKWDGLTLFIDMSDRSYTERWANNGEYIFTDSVLYDIEDVYLSYLSDGDYNKAFSKFASMSESELAKNESRLQALRSWDSMSAGEKASYKLRHIPALTIVAPIIIALIVALIMTSKEKKKLTSVYKQTGAAQYEVDGSFNLSESRDIFLYKTVTKTRIESSSSSGGSRSSGGGGSSHGGHSGHF